VWLLLLAVAVAVTGRCCNLKRDVLSGCCRPAIQRQGNCAVNRMNSVTSVKRKNRLKKTRMQEKMCRV
jgi:hypothetical protein